MAIKLLLFFHIFISIYQSYAQNNHSNSELGGVMYYYIIGDWDTTRHQPRPDEFCVLYFQRNKSFSVNTRVGYADTLRSKSTNNSNVVSVVGGNLAWFRDLEQPELIEFIQLDGFGKYTIVEKLPTINWQIDFNQVKKFGSLTCNLAKGSFRGRNYTAWFCPEIPISHGPWKLSGLPGLILEAYDETKEVKILFDRLVMPQQVSSQIQRPNTHNAISRDKFVKILDKKIKAIQQSLRSDGLLAGGMESSSEETVIFRLEFDEDK
ncbi:MAG: GLPGLI family protein [Microscillaceae bacterium]|jgi:GLPGLI family protein|nr:GLPGLI family protein [Microscillaceae bacterium]